jgi:hypothetical protein
MEQETLVMADSIGRGGLLTHAVKTAKTTKHQEHSRVDKKYNYNKDNNK